MRGDEFVPRAPAKLPRRAAIFDLRASASAEIAHAMMRAS